MSEIEISPKPSRARLIWTARATVDMQSNLFQEIPALVNDHQLKLPLSYQSLDSRHLKPLPRFLQKKLFQQFTL